MAVLNSFPKDTACGPSGLRIQHLIDAAEVPLQLPITSSIIEIVNLLASGQVPSQVAKYLAGGSLIALEKHKPDCPPDVRPIAIGECLRRLTGKCLCIVSKQKAADFFFPHQMGVACPSGSEKIIHGLRCCVDEHWFSTDFTVLKIDLRNAFNLVSRQAVLDECLHHFPELFPWTLWCYGQHPSLLHSLGTISSESGVQQGDPMGSLLFCLVLQKLVSAIAEDKDCSSLLFHKWYIDDGVIAGPKQAVAHALSIIQDLGPPLGLHINIAKCELYSPCDLSLFPSDMKRFTSPHFEILGAPIGDIIFCGKFVAQKRAEARHLLTQLEEVGSVDPQVALLLLRLCGSFCRLVHLARSIPPSLIVDGLALFDNDVRHCFAECTMVDTSDAAWQQAQLSLSRGGLGLRRLSLHSPAAYIASAVASDCSSPQSKHLLHVIDLFNASVPTTDELTITSITTSNLTQKLLSAKLEDQQFTKLFANASLPDRARLLSISSPHSSAWLSVTPSPRLNLHLDPSEFQVAIKWWLGLPVSQGQLCPQCMSHSLDQFGHHALSCKNGPDVVSRHNRVRDTLFEFCQRACLGAQLEAGSSLGHEARQTRPADVLIPNWELGKPAAIDLCVTSPLNSNTLQVACVTPNSAAMQAEQRKHHSNDAKCEELGWVCISLVVESYGSWGPEAQRCLSRLAGRLATQLGQPKSLTTNLIYGRLNLTLIRANSRAILSRLYV